MDAARETRSLWTFEFLALCLVTATAFCNVSAFYSFYHYLGVIDVPIVWRGFLVGLEPMAAFALRLFVLPALHLRNAFWMTMAALMLLVAVSCSYLFVATVSGLIVVRILHGSVFVLLTSAAISLMVAFIPEGKSGQGFSAMSLASMIPYAVVPPLSEALLPHVRNAADIYAGVSLISLASFALMLKVRGRIMQAIDKMDAVLMQKWTLTEIRENFRSRIVLILLTAILFLYLAHAGVFYFLKNLSEQNGVGQAGVFFGVSMAAMIAVRFWGTLIFDRFDKARLLCAAFILMTVCLAVLPVIRSVSAFYLIAAGYGLAVGVAPPVINALLFSSSTPAMRGLNTNLTLFAMDLGYFLTPYIGGMLIAMGASFGSLFYLAASDIALALLLVIVLTKRGRG